MTIIVHAGSELAVLPKPLYTGAKLDFLMVWDDWLNGDTISTISVSVSPSGLTVTGEAVNADAVTVDGVSRAAGTVTTAWLEAGSGDEGQDFIITYSIVTAAGRKELRSFELKVRPSTDPSD